MSRQIDDFVDPFLSFFFACSSFMNLQLAFFKILPSLSLKNVLRYEPASRMIQYAVYLLRSMLIIRSMTIMTGQCLTLPKELVNDVNDQNQSWAMTSMAGQYRH